MPTSPLQQDSASGYAIRLARQLHLKPDEEHTFSLESSYSSITVTLGKEHARANCRHYGVQSGSRPIRIEGILRWHGLQYEIQIHDISGSGTRHNGNRIELVDRVAQQRVDPDLSLRIYQTLIPIIELQIQDILLQARKRKS